MESEGDTSMLERVERLLTRVPQNGGWDRGFIESVMEQLGTGRTLSPRQQEVLGKIEGRFSDEALDARAEWEDSWDDDKQQRFNIAVKYYGRTGYYQNIVQRAWNQTDFVPSFKEYNALTNNKYAVKVIENVLAEGKYPVGSLVQFRKSNRVNHRLRGKTGMVVAHNDEVKTHAKGGKPYSVVLIGESEIKKCEERDLKNAARSPQKRS